MNERPVADLTANLYPDDCVSYLQSVTDSEGHIKWSTPCTEDTLSSEDMSATMPNTQGERWIIVFKTEHHLPQVPMALVSVRTHRDQNLEVQFDLHSKGYKVSIHPADNEEGVMWGLAEAMASPRVGDLEVPLCDVPTQGMSPPPRPRRSLTPFSPRSEDLNGMRNETQSKRKRRPWSDGAARIGAAPKRQRRGKKKETQQSYGCVH